MGQFSGHIVPGTFFIGLSVWWIVSIFKRYFGAHFNPRAEGYQNTWSFVSKQSQGCHFEAILKLVAAIIGIVKETIDGFNDDWEYVYLAKSGPHIMMFSFYALNALADLAIFHKMPLLPKEMDYVTAICAASVEGYLFINHLHGRSLLDVKMHMSLIVIIALCVWATVIEMVGDKHDVRLGLLRSCFYLWQGTWFYQVGFVLYPPTTNGFPIWDHNSHHDTMVMDLFFMGHLMFVILVTFGFGVIMYVREKRMQHGNSSTGHTKRNKTKTSGGHHYEAVLTHDSYADE